MNTMPDYMGTGPPRWSTPLRFETGSNPAPRVYYFGTPEAGTIKSVISTGSRTGT